MISVVLSYQLILWILSIFEYVYSRLIIYLITYISSFILFCVPVHASTHKGPVSYTHLYLMPRHEKQFARSRAFSAPFHCAPMPASYGCAWLRSVSYTHLDVYKRQVQTVRTAKIRDSALRGHARTAKENDVIALINNLL